MFKSVRLLALAGAASQLAAQVPDTTPRDTIPVAPVTVTATRSERALFEVPLAVTRVGKPDLFGTAGYGVNDALGFVPGVVAQSRSGGSDVRIMIRGFGARGAGDRSNSGTSRGIRVLLDGFPETEPDGRTSFDGIDLAAAHAIEVVRSNGSAVWGNAAGGVVSVTTVPDFDQRFAALEPLLGSFGLARTAARGGITLGENGGGAKVAGSFVHTAYDGWRAHSDSRRSLLNVTLVSPVADRTKLGVFAMASRTFFRIPGPLTAAEVAVDPRQANATYQARDERRDNLVGRIGVTLDQRLGAQTSVSALLFVNPKLLHRSERGTYRDFNRTHLGGSVVVRAGRLSAGVDEAVQDGAILFYALTPAGTRGDTLRNNQREGARNFGVFAQAEVPVGARVGLTLGARYDDITYEFQDFLAPALDAHKAFRGVTPKLGVNVRLAPAHSVFASLGGGIEAPAGNETDPASTFGQDTITGLNPLLQPIRSTTVEVGTRQIVLRNHAAFVRELAYDVALYQTAVRNEIVPYRGGRFYFTAGSVRRRGAELGVRVAAAGGLTLQGALALSDHRYRRYMVDSVHYGQPGSFADYSGNQVVGVPRTTYTIGAGVTPRPIAPVTLRVTFQGASAYFADDANQIRVAGYGLTHVTLGIDEPLALGGGIALRGFVTINNLFDRAHLASAFLNPDVVGGVPVAFEPGLPRSVLVSVSLAGAPATR